MPTNLNLFSIKLSFENMKQTGSSDYYYRKYACMCVCFYSKWCLFFVEWHCRALFCSEVLKWSIHPKPMLDYSSVLLIVHRWGTYIISCSFFFFLTAFFFFQICTETAHINSPKAINILISAIFVSGLCLVLVPLWKCFYVFPKGFTYSRKKLAALVLPLLNMTVYDT